MIGASPRKLSDIGLEGVAQLSDAELRLWLADTLAFNNAMVGIGETWERGTGGRLYTDPNDPYGLHGGGNASMRNGFITNPNLLPDPSTHHLEGYDAHLAEYNRLKGNYGSRGTNWNPHIGHAQSSMGHGGGAPGHWIMRIIDELGPDFDPATVDLNTARNIITKSGNKFLEGGLANSFLNTIGPIALGAMAGGALSGAAGLTSVGALPSPTSFINIGGNLIPATTSLATGAAGATAGGLLGMESLYGDMGYSLTPAELLGGGSTTPITLGTAAGSLPILGIEDLPANVIGQDLPLHDLMGGWTPEAATGGWGATMENVWGEPSIKLGQPGIDDLVTQAVDETIYGIGPNSAAVVSSIPGSLPLGTPGTGVNWGKVWDGVKWVARGANVVGQLLTDYPEYPTGPGGPGGGGAPYNPPGWVFDDGPDYSGSGYYTGNYMDRSGEWEMGLSPGEQANLLAIGKAPPRDYTKDNYRWRGSNVPRETPPTRMLIDPSLSTLPQQWKLLPSTGTPKWAGPPPST